MMLPLFIISAGRPAHFSPTVEEAKQHGDSPEVFHI